jgi:hypothetical protein
MSWLPNWLTGFDSANYDAGIEADRRNAQITEDLKNKGLITEAEAAQSQQRYTASENYDPYGAIDDAFSQGLDEGAANIRRTVGGAINGIAITPLKIIPWQIWLAGGLYLAWRLGAFKNLLSK